MSDLLDVERAQVSRDDEGAVVFDDPHSPWVVRAWVADHDGRACLSQLQVTSRTGGEMCITTARLGRLPLAQIQRIAAAEILGAGHTDEVYYRLLARPKPSGTLSWDEEHYERVLAVYTWARETGRPGGGAQAVADMWGVAKNPTAWRWLARARRLAAR